MDFEDLKSEVNYKAVKSSGSGGQHVNKVATKVELYFNVFKSEVLSEEQRAKLVINLSNRINKNGYLILSCSATRSQLKNKEIVTKRFLALIEDGLKEETERKPTKIPKAVKKKRLENKRQQSQKKTNRKPPDLI
ncbi:alternative ribosome rescue aminoacyl-tRNA hydrolase ArfB [Winogradskyella aurantia]|uniref:Aminoacyl-tRNA hydrolase n=1 Tax=Winogradskyella aurantia TaxID=1915063 RepID=A0A265UZX5_9FLAO|nr:alternative ribosome rescue aminoacyl-tRNA hydrolase ArfB [Winogradskyella aurantia]OZV70617.1 aminoacyl-tRNA hydrolase [Winogradskyella aurantia]